MNKYNIRKLRSLILGGFSLLCLGSFAQQTVRDQYICKYYELAIQEMQNYGIPASITMAQGILESGNGTTYLATAANNHFGIKCHDWTGPWVLKDDDAKDECFRKYEHPLHSYEDHSKFLTTRSRYAFLFDFKVTDYVAWAKGLKKAGYATDPKYPDKLIKIIEDNELYLLDKYALSNNPKKSNLPQAIRESAIAAVSPTIVETVIEEVEKEAKNQSVTSIIEQVATTVQTSPEGLDYIIVQSEKTYAQIALVNNLHKWEVCKYNDVPKRSDKNPEPGERIYLQLKLSQCKTSSSHIVKEGETMYDIAQFYGVRLKSLYKINKVGKGTEPKLGQTIYLNKKAAKRATEK